MHRPISRVVFLSGLAALAIFSGCSNMPAQPSGWESRPAVNADFQDPPAALQLIVCYGQVTSHSAIRVVGPGGGPVFWDPGGAYGEEPPVIAKRVNDVVYAGAPTLRGYWDYRRSIEVRSNHVAIMEWQVSRERAEALRRPLLIGYGEVQPTEGDPDFNTDIMATACGLAVASYLQQFSEEVDIPKRWLQPSNMGNYLWANHPPTRVLFWSKDQPPQVFTQSRARQAARPE